MVRQCKAKAIRFSDDGIVPNNPRWPLILYRRALRFSTGFEPGTVIDSLFETNGRGRSWRDSIYDFVHYHSQVHEVLGVASGHALVEFGGVRGRRLRLAAGDVAICRQGSRRARISSSSEPIRRQGSMTNAPTHGFDRKRSSGSLVLQSLGVIRSMEGTEALSVFGDKERKVSAPNDSENSCHGPKPANDRVTKPIDFADNLRYVC